MTFRTFDNGIRIANGFAIDPATGKIGDLYWNTTRLELRQCYQSTPSVLWEDVTVKHGSAAFSTLYWDAVNGKWAENVLLLTNGRTIFAPTSASPSPSTIQSGDTTNAGVAGSNLVLQPGAGALGQGDIEIKAINITQTPNLGTTLNVKAGADTVNAAGNDLNLLAGQGTSTLGNVNASGQEVNIASGSKIRLNGGVVFNQILTADPASPETSQLYWNTIYKRFRKFDGTNWHWINTDRYSSPIVIIDLLDDTILSLPATTTTLVDVTTVTDGMLVVMQHSGLPAIYLASVSGINITWTVQHFGQSATSQASIGDSIFVRNGANNVNGFYFYQSSGSWINPNASSGSSILAGISSGNTTFWNGTQWIPDQVINNDGAGGFYIPNNGVADANKAPSFAVSASSKTAGTGDGGDLNLNGGATTGGVIGDVLIYANTLLLPQITTTPAVRTGGLFFNTITGKPRIGSQGTFRDLDSADVNGEITGFPNLTDSAISFVDGTRTLTITQTASIPIAYYIKGRRYFVDTTVTPQTVIISNTVGNHYIYFNNLGVLTANTVYDLQDGLKNTALIAVINWNGTTSTLVSDRRTLLTMDGDARFNKRNVQAIEVRPGDFISASTIGANTLSMNGGSLYLEELVRSVTAQVSGAGMPMVYLSGTNVMNVDAAVTNAMRNNGTNLFYNLNTAGTWSQAVITPTVEQAFNVWIAVTTDPTRPIVMLQPQQVYNSLAEAMAVSPESITSFWSRTEYRIVSRATFINTTGTTFALRKVVSMTDTRPIWTDNADLVLSQNTEKDYFAASSLTQDMYWNPTTGVVTWTQPIQIALPHLPNATNSLSAGTATLSTDDQVGYVTVNKRNAIAAALSLTVTTVTTFEADTTVQQNRIIVFKRVGGEVYFMRGAVDKLRKRIALADNQVAAASIFDFPNSTTPNYAYQVEYSLYRNGIMETGTIMVVRGAIGNIAQSIAGASTGSTGVVLTVAEAGSTLQLQYTSTSTTQIPIFRFKITSWLAT